MSGHNEAFVGQVSRDAWVTFEGTTPAYPKALTAEFIRRGNVIRFAGGTAVALTFPDAAQSDLSGRIIWFVNESAQAMTVEATANYGGLAGTSTFTVAHGGLGAILCGSAFYYAFTSANTLS